ncbi:hypothetical protein K501DRAFT_270655 [Backusella circina FSU 941]|nr:hypothetical protein K501DRAFT_270655 [Backusella circina FSU 941]
MVKLGESSPFTGLYTVNMGYEEIVHQVLVPSKLFSNLKYTFEKMREAYISYAHQMPVAFLYSSTQLNPLEMLDNLRNIYHDSNSSGGNDIESIVTEANRKKKLKSHFRQRR